MTDGAIVVKGTRAGIALFTTAQLDAIVKETLPPSTDAAHAIVGTVDARGASVVAGFKVDSKLGTWTFQGAYVHDWADGADTIGTRVLWTW
jgi:hypothetical protein